MSDMLAGKYRQHYKHEFALAKVALAPFGGTLEWSTADYEAFVFSADGLRIIFYPHRTSARNHHIRVRDSGSKNKAKLIEALGRLRIAAGNCCTFKMKNMDSVQFKASLKINPSWITERSMGAPS